MTTGERRAGDVAQVGVIGGSGLYALLDGAAEYLIEELSLPVRNGLARTSEFAVSGSLLRAHVSGDHPITYGLPREVAVFQDEALAFDTVPTGPEMERQVLASYPRAAPDVLLSGWVRGAEAITRKAAAVAVSYGKGKVVLLGFRPQHRAQTPGTFPFLFGALYWSTSR